SAPNTVRNLTVETQTNSSITLRWEAPNGPEPENYWVQWTGDGNATGSQNTTNTTVTVEGLEAGTLYEFSVSAVKDGVSSSWVLLNGTTVSSCIWKADMSGTVLAPHAWPLFCGPHFLASRRLPMPGYFCFALRRRRLGHHGCGVEGRVPWGSSPFSLYPRLSAPTEVMDLQKQNQTNSSITLRWEAPADPRPQFYVYWVQWASSGHPQRKQDPQGQQDSQTGRTNGTCYTVGALLPGTRYRFSVWAESNGAHGDKQSLNASTAPDPANIVSCVITSGGHQAILNWSCPQGGYETFELEVGGQLGPQNRSSCGSAVEVLLGRPTQPYSATVTTIWDEMRAPSASVACHVEGGPAGVIAGAVVGVLLLLVLVGLLVFFLKRHRKREKKTTPKDLQIRFPGDILAEDFAQHVWRNEKDSNYGFAEEYQVGHAQLGGSHRNPQPRSATFWTLMLVSGSRVPPLSPAPTPGPFLPRLPLDDWSRVPLRALLGQPGSEYINASFIPGLWNSREFIAAQGPLPQTVGDFWRLVWEQQSHTLVMLTNCVESGRVKCEHYWPLDAQPCTHGPLQVTLMGEEVTENWTTLSVRQFHYVTWPDHGVPHSPDPLLAFWRMLRQWLDQTVGGGPPIVHCSAGVGRTGTLIALDVLLRQLECEGLVGPFGYVKKMRESRPLMVQTEAQYVFLHQCILRFLQQSAAAQAQKGATYENLLMENTAATEA
ncbi:hypothetical protein FD755_006823, partial [Muntiacus reevesi]